MKVLFVCLGNVARSQMAEAFFNEMYTGDDWEAESGGTASVKRGYAGKNIEKVSSGIVDCMKDVGINISQNVSKQLTKEMVEGADRVVVMADRSTWPDYLNEGGKVEIWDVVDPKDENGYDFQKKVSDKIKGKVEDLIKEINSRK